MDSLTQMVLGAAVGEVVLGKKAGNRAMLVGAIGGTIPDLDILAYFVTDEMSALAFHRGLMHSIFFAVVAPFFFGWLTARFYEKEIYKKRTYKTLAFSFWVFVFVAVIFQFNKIIAPPEGGINWGVIKYFALGGAVAGYGLWHFFFRSKPLETTISWKEWAWLFFWSIFTHPLLDSCTSYGTQLFQPFWDYRVALNNISVVDPLYTVPFLICVLVAGFFSRNNVWRQRINWLGIGLSSAYMLFTGYNKIRVDRVFERSFAEKGIEYRRYRTAPTILNNILWQGVAEGDSLYYYGEYSLLDAEPRVLSFLEFPKNHYLIDKYAGNRDVEILKWFSKGYYWISERPDGKLQFNDLRTISLGSTGKERVSVFKFTIEEKDGKVIVKSSDDDRAPTKEALDMFFKRIRGIAEN
ncbi:MAG: metal-dependent hydrolase [Bacteroidetes bacterium]|nr:MAG: metal-dependent hydrolase [Bacteroidota bacterium]